MEVDRLIAKPLPHSYTDSVFTWCSDPWGGSESIIHSYAIILIHVPVLSLDIPCHVYEGTAIASWGHSITLGSCRPNV